MAAGPPFTVVRFGARWCFSAFLLFATYNPTGYSYYDWVTGSDDSYLSVKVVVGLWLLWTYTALLPIVWHAIGPVGIGAMAALLASSGLVLWDYGFLDYITPSFYPYAIIGGMATIIAMGLTWGHVNLQVWHLKLVRKIAPKAY